MKKCSKCKETKELEQFSKNKKEKSGYNCWCKSCFNLYMKAYYLRNKEGISKYKTEWYRSNEFRIKQQTHKARQDIKARFKKLLNKAKGDKRNCDLSLELYSQIVEDKKCFYCKDALPRAGSGLDRVDSSRGYELDNVVPCCTRCNKAKNNMSQASFIEHIIKIYNNVVKTTKTKE